MARNLLVGSFFACLAFALATPAIDVRIAGGITARVNQFPYQVAIFIQTEQIVEPLGDDFCSGSLISQNYVLTSARCLAKADKVTLFIGSSELDNVEPTQESTEFIIPSDYKTLQYEWDVALIKLSTPVELSDSVQPINLDDGDDDHAGDLATVAGWGATYAAQITVEPVLKYIENVIISYGQCVKDNNWYQQIVTKEGHICQWTVGNSACRGDSGAPLVIDKVQVGIASYIPANCFRLHPVVYTRVSHYIDWIRENSDI